MYEEKEFKSLVNEAYNLGIEYERICEEERRLIKEIKEKTKCMKKDSKN